MIPSDVDSHALIKYFSPSFIIDINTFNSATFSDGALGYIILYYIIIYISH